MFNFYISCYCLKLKIIINEKLYYLFTYIARFDEGKYIKSKIFKKIIILMLLIINILFL